MKIDIDGQVLTTTPAQDAALAWLANQRAAELTAEAQREDPEAKPVVLGPGAYVVFVLASALQSYEQQHSRVAVEAKVKADLAVPSKVTAAKEAL